MDIVFMNRLVKAEGLPEEASAQIWIGEEEGHWHLGWREQATAEDVQDSDWYEGGSWHEMLCIYRHGLAVKMGEGYRPLIEGIFHEEEEWKGRNHKVQKLYCYSELNPREDLYTELCAWRRKKSATERKAPYFIASNRVLRLVSTFVPHTIDELLQLPGVGESKASEYGEDLLELTSKIERKHTFPLDWVKEQLDEEAYLSWIYKQKELKYKQDLDQYRLRRELLRGIADGLNLQQLVETCKLSRRDMLDTLEQLEKEGYDTDKLIELELQNMPQEEIEEIWSAFEELGDTFLKPVLQRVYGQEAATGGGTELAYERLRMIRIQFRRKHDRKRNAG